MTECSRERGIVQAIAAGQRFDAFDEELRDHISACGACSDVVMVARALQEERDCAFDAARLPAAGLVWWRAELRARQDANRAAERPMNLVTAFSAACTISVSIALIAGLLPWLRASLADFSDVPRLSPQIDPQRTGRSFV